MKRLHVGLWVVALFLQNSYGTSFTLSGSVVSDNQKMITSRYMGFVREVNANEGDKVRKGDLLYTIDSQEIDSAKSQVELGIAQAKLASQMYENQYLNVQLNLERHKRLLEKDMVSKFDVENLELAEKNLKAMVEISQKQITQAQAKMQEVLNQYQYLKIKAPNDSVVIAKNIKVGEMAMPGMPSFVLSDLSSLKVSTEVSESNLKDVQVGKKVAITIPSLEITMDGVVESIIPSSNPMTHTFRIKIKFEKQNKAIYPGMYAVVVVD